MVYKSNRQRATEAHAHALSSPKWSFRQAAYYHTAGRLYEESGDIESALDEYRHAVPIFQRCEDNVELARKHARDTLDHIKGLKRKLEKQNDSLPLGNMWKDWKGRNMFGIVGISASFLLALFMFSQSITGYAVSGLSSATANVAGVIFLLLALTGLKMYLHNRDL